MENIQTASLYAILDAFKADELSKEETAEEINRRISSEKK